MNLQPHANVGSESLAGTRRFRQLPQLAIAQAKSFFQKLWVKQQTLPSRSFCACVGQRMPVQRAHFSLAQSALLAIT